MFARKQITGIQGKTALIFIGVFILIILPVNSIVYLKVKQILIQADTKELVAEGDKLFGQVRLDPQRIPLPAIGYSIFLQAGTELQLDSLFASPDFPSLLRPIYYQSLVEIDTFKIVTLLRPIQYTNAILYFSIARSNKRITSQIGELKLYLFAANLISILIAGVLVYFVSGYTLTPIRKIILVAERINASKSIERVPVPDSNDENRHLAQTINDMLARIEASIKNQTNFFASAAHELKTPLAVMQTELGVALQRNNEASINQLLQSQLSEVERLDRTIQDFLLISQLKSETLVLRKIESRLDEALYTAISRCKLLAKEKKSQLKMTINEADQPFLCLIDLDKMETALSNLIENAIRYSKHESVISIQLFRKEKLIVRIQNAIDSPIENIECLKDEFKKSTELSSGLGMGLWISEQMIKMQGGELHLTQGDNTFEAQVIV